jgi:hypothetical protein
MNSGSRPAAASRQQTSRDQQAGAARSLSSMPRTGSSIRASRPRARSGIEPGRRWLAVRAKLPVATSLRWCAGIAVIRALRTRELVSVKQHVGVGRSLGVRPNGRTPGIPAEERGDELDTGWQTPTCALATPPVSDEFATIAAGDDAKHRCSPPRATRPPPSWSSNFRNRGRGRGWSSSPSWREGPSRSSVWAPRQAPGNRARATASGDGPSAHEEVRQGL